MSDTKKTYIVTSMKLDEDEAGLIYGDTIRSKLVLAESAKQAAYIAFREILMNHEKELFDKYYYSVVEKEWGMLKISRQLPES